MSITHRAYLFEIERYLALMRPIVENLENDDHSTLHNQALAVAKSRPEIWTTLADYRLFPGDLGNEELSFDSEQGRTYFWMMIVLASNLVPISTPIDYAKSITAAARHFIGDETLLATLSHGLPMCKLYYPDLALDAPTRHPWSPKWPKWCRLGAVGWIDRADITLLRELLEPQRFGRGAKPVKQAAWSEANRNAYKAAIEMLSAAEMAQKGLLLAVVD